MTVDEILNAELTAEEIDQLLIELTKRKQMLFEERRKQAFINFEKAFDKLMKVSPSETIYIDFNNDEGVSYTVDILDVFGNYFKNMSTEYDIE